MRTIRINYAGDLQDIKCNQNATYEDLMADAIRIFVIPKEFHDYLVIINDSGRVLEKNDIENPNHLDLERLFFIRLACSRLPATVAGKRHLAFPENEEVLNNINVKVYRQNCFLGSMPVDFQEKCDLQTPPPSPPPAPVKRAKIVESKQQMKISKVIRKLNYSDHVEVLISN